MSVLFLCLTLTVCILYPGQPLRAATSMPPVWDILTEDFESGSLSAWNTENGTNLSLIAGAGHNNSAGLSVAVSQSNADIYQNDVAKAEEGYLTFWFNPNSVDIPDPTTSWPPANALCIAQVVTSINSHWRPVISLYLRKPSGQGYQGFLAWPTTTEHFYDYQNGQFNLANGWQKITLGYHINRWVAVWVNDEMVRYSTDVKDEGLYADVIALGQVESNTRISPSGAIRFDDAVFQVLRVGDLWVDAAHGSDANNGLTAVAAFRTIQKAADIAGPGSIVHILPGVYRETIRPVLSGSAAEPAVYRAENGPGTVILRGSEPSSSLVWTQLTANTIGLPLSVDPTKIYSADLSSWNLSGSPRFIAELDANGQVVARLPLAREPDWQVVTAWKYHEFWWAADGGSTPAACDPITNLDHNCDLPQRSMTQLTDRTNDAQPDGLEAGNLTTLGDLTGATLVALDTVQGHSVYRRTIVAHDVANGRVTVERPCASEGNAGLGWGTKYYLEGKPQLLDSPGEWWYDAVTKLLYLWPTTPSNPASLNIEISQRINGFSLKNRSYVTLDGLTVEFIHGSAVSDENGPSHKSYHNVVRRATLRYANEGVYIEKEVSASAPPDYVTDGFTVEDSEIGYMDSHAIHLNELWDNNSAADSFTHSGILNTVIRNNEMHHLGFRSDGDNAEGLVFPFANKLRFEGNHVHDVAHNGVQFSESVIQSPKAYGFSPSEIKTGDVVILNNTFERTCQLTTDCGGLKLWGKPPDNHVFRNVLITGNIFRDIFGWTYVSEKRQRWADSASVTGGFGLYVDYASGIHAYRNVSYNNAYTGYMFYGTWRDGDIIYYNNIAANSLFGFSLGGPQFNTHGNINTQILDNILVNNEGYGVWFSAANGNDANITFNQNLYFNNGWRSTENGGVWKPGDMAISNGASSKHYQTLSQIQANTTWEAQGVEGDPAFWSYNVADHDLHDGSLPDFHLTSASVNVIDRGVTALPTSLTTLLTTFQVVDPHWGAAFDIGRYEGGFALFADPSTQAIESGGTARYLLHAYPPDLPYAITLTVASPSPSLTVAVDPTILAPGGSVTVTVSDLNTGTFQKALWYTVAIIGNGGGSAFSGSVELLVGGASVYLPVVWGNPPP